MCIRDRVALTKRWEDFHFDGSLNKGARDEAVLKLQEILVQKEFLNHKPTGYFGTLTKQALIDFQLAEGLIITETSAGAGTVGPQTRARLNELLESEKNWLAADGKAQAAYVFNENSLKQLVGIPTKGGNNVIVKK